MIKPTIDRTQFEGALAKAFEAAKKSLMAKLRDCWSMVTATPDSKEAALLRGKQVVEAIKTEAELLNDVVEAYRGQNQMLQEMALEAYVTHKYIHTYDWWPNFGRNVLAEEEAKAAQALYTERTGSLRDSQPNPFENNWGYYTSLDDAIKNCEASSERCSDEHMADKYHMLAKWLTELKGYREQSQQATQAEEGQHNGK